MHFLITRRIPEIIKISADKLDSSDLFYLNVKYKTDRSEFTVCDSRREKILVNKSLDFVDDIIPLINQIMGREYLDDGVTEGLFDTFSDIAGEKAGNILYFIWLEWQKERRKVELKEQADKILAKIKNMRLRKYLRSRKETAREIFSIGFGTYDNKAHADFQNGTENAFLYGYLCCLEDIKSHRIKGFCEECG